MVESKSSLKNCRLPSPVLKESFWDSFEECRRLIPGATSRNAVTLHAFYKQLRITLAIRDLNQKVDKKFSYPDFPEWAFLYNLDLYISQISTLPDDKRLTLQTGSQKETQQNGFVTNGLNPDQDYRQHVYMTHA